MTPSETGVVISGTEIMGVPKGDQNLLLKCTRCDELYAGSATQDGDLIPDGAAIGGQYHECDGDKFEQAILDTDADRERQH